MSKRDALSRGVTDRQERRRTPSQERLSSSRRGAEKTKKGLAFPTVHIPIRVASGISRLAPPTADDGCDPPILRHGLRRVGSARARVPGPTEAKLAFAVAGIFFAFGAFAVLQEDVYRTSYAGERFSATFLVLIVERSVNTAVGALGALLLARPDGGDESADRVRSSRSEKIRASRWRPSRRAASRRCSRWRSRTRRCGSSRSRRRFWGSRAR